MFSPELSVEGLLIKVKFPIKFPLLLKKWTTNFNINATFPLFATSTLYPLLFVEEEAEDPSLRPEEDHFNVAKSKEKEATKFVWTIF